MIQAMLINSITVYAWPIATLKTPEKTIRNCIWSGDINKRKLVSVSWKILCKPIPHGGLGPKSLICLNEANNLKFCLDMLTSIKP